jgi:hypothetical protein
MKKITKRLNTYIQQFYAECPVNGKTVDYQLEITTEQDIPVEHIQTFTSLIKKGLHEAIADDLWDRFGGHQFLQAHHHGTTIRTIRSGEE